MEQIRQCGLKLNDVYKDEFYGKLIEEQMEILDREKNLFRSTKDQRYVDASLSDLLSQLLAGKQDQEKDVRDIKNSLKLQEKYYFMMAIRGWAKAGKWEEVTHFIQMKKTPVTYSFLAEICVDHKKIPLAVEAIKKISDYDEKIPMLIDIEQWRDAIEECFNGKRMEYLDDVKQKGPSFVEDFIREEQQKRGLK